MVSILAGFLRNMTSQNYTIQIAPNLLYWTDTNFKLTLCKRTSNVIGKQVNSAFLLLYFDTYASEGGLPLGNSVIFPSHAACSRRCHMVTAGPQRVCSFWRQLHVLRLGF